MIRKLGGLIAIAGLAVAVVASVMRPADSVEVERGAALFLTPIVILTWIAAHVAWPTVVKDKSAGPIWKQAETWFTVFGWGFLLWLAIAGFSVFGEGNVRYAVNEWWWWCSSLVSLLAARRILNRSNRAAIFLSLLVAVVAGESAFAAHQQWVSLPNDRARYERDPEGVLEDAGIEAPEGSPQRMLFEARLYGGGATGTFSLANSLAGLMVLGIPLAFGLAVRAWQSPYRWPVAIVSTSISLTSMLVLAWTDSRSAYLSLICACAVGIGAWVILKPKKDPLQSLWLVKNGRWLWLAFVVMGCITSISIALMPSLWSLAPRSLEFRFQYWYSTLRLALDQPLFGAGPGNFQQCYGLYRLDQASESIADPHNWLMELLGTGGFVGLALFLCSAISALVISKGTRTTERSATGSLNSVVLIGLTVSVTSFLTFVLTTAYWIITLQLPNIDAMTWAAVAFAAVFFVLWSGAKAVGQAQSSTVSDGGSVSRSSLGSKDSKTRAKSSSRGSTAQGSLATEPAIPGVASDFSLAEYRSLSWVLAALTGVIVHLFASGGLTVPGLALPTIVLIGILLPIHFDSEPTFVVNRGPFFVVTPFVTAAVLIVLWWITAWAPTTRAAEFLSEAARSLSMGQVRQGLDYFDKAAEADRWDAEIPVSKSETLRWLAVAAGDEQEAEEFRQLMATANDEALKRNPGAGLIWFVRSQQLLTLYQRWGNEADVEAARDALRHAIGLGPTETAWHAQLAVVEKHLANDDQAARMRARATDLSLAGGHSERSLDVVGVLVVEQVGEPVVRVGPRRVAASELFSTW